MGEPSKDFVCMIVLFSPIKKLLMWFVFALLDARLRAHVQAQKGDHFAKGNDLCTPVVQISFSFFKPWAVLPSIERVQANR